MQRHQFKRGRKLPPGVRFVARPSRWGNPYRIPPHTREEAMRLYRAHAEAMLREDPQWLEPLKEAEGRAETAEKAAPKAQTRSQSAPKAQSQSTVASGASGNAAAGVNSGTGAKPAGQA